MTETRGINTDLRRNNLQYSVAKPTVRIITEAAKLLRSLLKAISANPRFNSWFCFACSGIKFPLKLLTFLVCDFGTSYIRLGLICFKFTNIQFSLITSAIIDFNFSSFNYQIKRYKVSWELLKMKTNSFSMFKV